MLCGPLYSSLLLYTSCPNPHPVRTRWTPPEPTNPLHKFIAWRLGLLLHLISHGATLLELFPSVARRNIISNLYACLDSTFPLITALTATPDLSIEQIYKRHLAPELRRAAVVDYSYTYFVRLLLPYILQSVNTIPPLVYTLAGCNAETQAESMTLFASLLRQVLIKREKMRCFLLTVFDSLRNDDDNWLANTIVIIVKYALLGNYPGATASVDFTTRRLVYALDRRGVINYLTSCAGKGPGGSDCEKSVTCVLLSTVFHGFFVKDSVDYQDWGMFCTGWDLYASNNQRALQVIINYFPLPPPANQIADIFRFIKPLQVRYRNIFYAIHANCPSYDTANWHTYIPTTRLTVNTAIACQVPFWSLQRLQSDFDADRCGMNLTTREWRSLGSLAAYLVDRWSFSILPGTSALYLEQCARIMHITCTSDPSPEKTSVMRCKKCNTVRFRPVGAQFPNTHVTMRVDLNYDDITIYCGDCDNPDLERLNLLGKYVQCFLDAKKTRSLVTLALCSACMHICVTGSYVSAAGVICVECQRAVKQRFVGPRACVGCCSVNTRNGQSEPVWTFRDTSNQLVNRVWCLRCTPPMFKKLVSPYPIFDLQTAIDMSIRARPFLRNTLPPKYIAMPHGRARLPRGISHRKIKFSEGVPSK